MLLCRQQHRKRNHLGKFLDKHGFRVVWRKNEEGARKIHMGTVYCIHMESSHIYRTERKDPMFKKAEERLKQEKGISHKEIREMANNIAQEIKDRAIKKGENPHAASVILHYFNEGDLYQEWRSRFAFSSDEPLLEREEIVEALKPIKVAILRELQKSHSDIAWYEQGDQLETTHRPIRHLSERHVVKELGSFVDEANLKALKELYDLDVRSPFIAYHHRASDKKTGLQISQEIPIDHIKDRLKETKRQPFSRSALQFLDNVRGLHFLVSHGFAFSDLSTDNLGINKKTNRGELFDLDTLVKQEDADDSTYTSKNHMYPPEIYASVSRNAFKKYSIDVPNRKKREPQAVYELGVSLLEIMQSYLNDRNSDLFLMVLLYAEAMTDSNPENRPSVEQILKDLGEYCPEPEAAHA